MSLGLPFLPETIYTPFYCEENIHQLCQAFMLQQEEVSVIFISNEQKTVALWNQKLSKEPESAVVWDYHVVLLLRSRRDEHWIYDFDTRLPFPCLLKDYFQHTFQRDVPRSYQSLFRIVPGHTYIEYFASDRSHMVNPRDERSAESQYRSPPPSYAPLRGRHATVANNLMRSFVQMISSEETFGNVTDLSAMLRLAES
ncbi:N-terminal glutamine amidase-domain-containing protein [Mycena galericulata]|nr:N-terminal glutamine amidase-domain-containing protein [Mycena galericulata]